MITLTIRIFRQMITPAAVVVSLVYILLFQSMLALTRDLGQGMTASTFVSVLQTIIVHIVLANIAYFVFGNVRHFFSSSNRDIVFLKLGKYQTAVSVVAAYVLFFLVVFLVPMLTGALVVHGDFIAQPAELLTFASLLLGVLLQWAIWPVVFAVWVCLVVKNDVLALLLWYFVIELLNLAATVIMFFTHFGDTGVYLFHLVMTLFCMFLLQHRMKSIHEFSFAEKLYGGILAKFASSIGLQLTSFHLKMLGMRIQIVYGIFSAIGFLLLITLLQVTGANTITFVKLFGAVVIPLLFALNQYTLIRIDETSGIMGILLLKSERYSTIVLNRWYSLLMPQLFFIALFLACAGLLSGKLGVGFILYAIMLATVFSSFNLFLSVRFKNSGIANLVLLAAVYPLLRDDVQSVINTSSIAKNVNIFAPVCSFTEHQPAFILYIIVLLLQIGIAGALMVIMRKRDRILPVV